MLSSLNVWPTEFLCSCALCHVCCSSACRCWHWLVQLLGITFNAHSACISTNSCSLLLPTAQVICCWPHNWLYYIQFLDLFRRFCYLFQSDHSSHAFLLSLCWCHECSAIIHSVHTKICRVFSQKRTVNAINLPWNRSILLHRS